MDNKVNEIEELIKLISKFPGLGPKSARRVVLSLLKNSLGIKDLLVDHIHNRFNWYLALLHYCKL